MILETPYQSNKPGASRLDNIIIILISISADTMIEKIIRSSNKDNNVNDNNNIIHSRRHRHKIMSARLGKIKAVSIFF